MKYVNKFIFFSVMLFFVSCGSDTLFIKIDSGHSGIHFNNEIIETDSVNIMDFANVYNGGGVGVADVNNDGLQDLYFTGNMVPNKLYLNKGDLTFEDITDASNTAGEGKWCRGVSMIDINNDGLMDMYVSASINSNAKLRENILYINKGADKNGIPHFDNQATAYGLNDTTHTTMSAFFDYDNDGDLDVFLAVNQIMDGDYPNRFRKLYTDGSFPSTCRLYRNDYNVSLKHAFFTNVSKEAGIQIEGYSHGAVVADINLDGWKDVYVTNDYLSTNVLYINQRNGTFKDESKNYFKHTAANAMGQDIVDINNDGLADVFELDMNPEDNYRKKMMLNPAGYQTYQNSDYFGYQYQYVRNTLQVNQGPSVNNHDSLGNPVFSEVAFFSGVAETDWSWTPLIADFDNDGFRDIIVTNGFPKDVTDHDFVAFRNQAYFVATKKQLLEQIPEVKISNYGYRNNGDLTFSKVTKEWGIDEPSFSNGAVYADLDNDGDLDFVINNINDEAFLYENTADNKKGKNNYLNIQFVSEGANRNGIGAIAELHYDHGKLQVYEHTPYRGYLSSVQMGAHFGLDTITLVDSVIIKWPDGKQQLLNNVKAGQTITVKHNDATIPYSWDRPLVATNTLFTKITDSVAPGIFVYNDDYIDFNIQKLIPHKLSEYGPGLAVTDINGDGLDDMLLGGAYGYSPRALLQQQGGGFVVKELISGASRQTKPSEDMGVLLFDADGDKDQDLYISSGGYESPANTANYKDLFFINDGKGNFIQDSTAIPSNTTSKSCVRASDYDKDGDLDLFVAGRCVPEKYPMPVSCFIYRNDSKDGRVIFSDVTKQVAPALDHIGLTCDALFTDFNNDGWEDLLLAGEFMPIKWLVNRNGKFELLATPLDKEVGWWTSIIAGDFDNDGDMDYVAGNAGRNSFYRPSGKYPVRVYAKDFDNNGSYDALPSVYLPAQDGTLKEFSTLTRDDLIKQMIEMRNKFKTYKDLATSTFDKVLTPEQLQGALVLSANNFSSSFIRNDGNGQFTIQPLPLQAQISSLFGMMAEDVDADGNLDIILTGNDYGTEVSTGRYDAFYGLVLKGDGAGGFRALSIRESGWYVPGNAKALVKFANAGASCLYAATQVRGNVEVFVQKQPVKMIRVNQDDAYALITLRNGKTRKTEFPFGSGFLSQPGRFINADAQVKNITVVNTQGIKRTL